MKFAVALLAVIGVASAGILPATIVNKVAVAPAEVTVVRQPVTITQHEPVLRSVSVPVRAVAYTAPAVATPIIAAPSLIATHGLAAPTVIGAPSLIGPHALAAHTIL